MRCLAGRREAQGRQEEAEGGAAAAQKQGDAFMQELVQAASKLGLLAAEDDDSANPDGDVAGGPAALGEAAAPGQEAWQTTPLPQSVGAKRKRLPGAAGA